MTQTTDGNILVTSGKNYLLLQAFSLIKKPVYVNIENITLGTPKHGPRNVTPYRRCNVILSPHNFVLFSMFLSVTSTVSV